MQAGLFPQQEICIRRHCMQALLHDAIDAMSREQDCCQGLLAGGGNLIESRTSVTKIGHRAPSLTDFCRQQDWIGIYLLARRQLDMKQMHRLSELVRRHGNASPVCYLLLESTQKGRVEARLFADQTCTAPLVLTLQEDGDLYPAAENR